MNPPELFYITSEEIINHQKEPLFVFVIKICAKLDIEIPNIGFCDTMISINPDDMTQTGQLAITWMPEDIPGLDKPLVYLCRNYPNGEQIKDHILFAGVIAHELRHIWQKTHHSIAYSENSKGYAESLYSPAEIDADAFAIAFMSEGTDMLNIGKHICKMEYRNNPDAFALRMDRAAKIIAADKKDKPPQKRKTLSEFIHYRKLKK